MSGKAAWNETFVESRVTYTMELDGKLIVVENVPARVNVDTGERVYAPETVEHLQALARGGRRPKCPRCRNRRATNASEETS